MIEDLFAENETPSKKNAYRNRINLTRRKKRVFIIKNKTN